MEYCKLCLTQIADKTNSHIIPKFLTKSLFYSFPSRHLLSIDRKQTEAKKQDTPKDSFLLCSICEKRFSVIETIFAKYIDQIHNFSNNPDNIRFEKDGPIEYLKCLQIDPTLFKQFVYSIIWRTSVTTLKEFAAFKLQGFIEENLRIFLDTSLRPSKAALLASNKPFINIPKYHFCLLKPIQRLYPPGSFLSAASLNTEIHLITLSEFTLMFFSDETTINSGLRKISNKQHDTVIVGLGSLESWRYLNDMLFSKFLESTASGTKV